MTELVKIKCDDCKFEAECADYGWEGCRKFTPKPKQPMTNEEWLRNATTEELAEWIAQYTRDVVFDVCCRNAPIQNEIGDGATKSVVVLKWLKEEHK